LSRDFKKIPAKNKKAEADTSEGLRKEERMKILMLIDRMESGGAETHVEMLASALCDLGDRVEVFSGGGRIADRMERRGIVQRRIPPVGRSPWRFFLARRCLKKLVKKENYDLLHAHTRTMALLSRGLAGRKRKTGSVVTVHAAFPNEPRLSRIAFCAQKTITVSENLRQRCIDVFKIPPESVTVIPNGVDCKIFYPSKTFAEHGTVLFASRLDEDCSLGAELLCKIAPRLIWDFSFLRICIAGGGNAKERVAELAGKANDECREIAGHDVITLLGTVDDMEKTYRSHRIFVGVSRAAMEATACGCAVILCGNEGRGGVLSLQRLVTDVDNLCCRGEALPDDVWLEGELRYLLENERRTALLAELGRAWVANDHRAEEIARRTRAVYQTVSEGEGGEK